MKTGKVNGLLKGVGIYAGADVVLRWLWGITKPLLKGLEEPLARLGDFDLIYGQWTQPTWAKSMADILISPPIWIPTIIVVIVGAYFWLPHRIQNAGRAIDDSQAPALENCENFKFDLKLEIETSIYGITGRDGEGKAERNYFFIVLRKKKKQPEAMYNLRVSIIDILVNDVTDPQKTVDGFEEIFKAGGRIPLPLQDKEATLYNDDSLEYGFLSYKIGMNSYDLRIDHGQANRYPENLYPLSIMSIRVLIMVQAKDAKPLEISHSAIFQDEGRRWNVI